MLKLAFAGAIALAFCSSASASGYHHRYKHHHRYAHHVVHRQVHHGHMPGPCYLAARQGGPCGCFAESLIFGRTDHVYRGRNLWLANAWLGFPKTKPKPGAAAVWPGRHVAIVTAVNSDGTVTVHDSWAVHRVRVSGLVFVDPHGG